MGEVLPGTQNGGITIHWESLQWSENCPPPTWQRGVRSEARGPTSCTPEGFWPLS